MNKLQITLWAKLQAKLRAKLDAGLRVKLGADLQVGMSIIEVVTALGILAVWLTALMVLESTVFRGVVKNRCKIDRLHMAKNILLQTAYEPLDPGKTVVEKNIPEKQTKVLYEKVGVKKESELSRFKGLYQETATALWYERSRVKELRLVRYGVEILEEEQEAQTSKTGGK